LQRDFFVIDPHVKLHTSHVKATPTNLPVSSFGFLHILEKHFCKNCPGEITLDDIINIDLVMQRGLKLINIGVSNPNNIVLNYKRGNKEHNLILKEEKNNELVISFYSID
jgi:hypothetical protein